MIHCAVCDDDIAVAEMLHALIKEYAAELDCAGFCDPLLLRSAIRSGQRFDLYLLDIVMPGFTGVELAREIRKSDGDAVIVFLTSSDEFRRDGFEVEALQYLDKPVDKAKLYRTFDRALRYIGEKKNQILPVHQKDGFVNLPIDQIVFVESLGHVLTFHMTNGSTVETLYSSMTLEKLIQMLRFPPFCMPHRSFIVNMNHVDCVQKFRFCMSNNDLIPIASKQFSRVRQQYADYVLTRLSKGDA